MATELIDIAEPEVDPQHLITLDGSLSGSALPRAICTCKWATDRSENLLKLATQARAHSKRTGHEMRRHDL